MYTLTFLTLLFGCGLRSDPEPPGPEVTCGFVGRLHEIGVATNDIVNSLPGAWMDSANRACFEAKFIPADFMEAVLQSLQVYEPSKRPRRSHGNAEIKDILGGTATGEPLYNRTAWYYDSLVVSSITPLKLRHGTNVANIEGSLEVNLCGNNVNQVTFETKYSSVNFNEYSLELGFLARESSDRPFLAAASDFSSLYASLRVAGFTPAVEWNSPDEKRLRVVFEKELVWRILEMSCSEYSSPLAMNGSTAVSCRVALSSAQFQKACTLGL